MKWYYYLLIGVLILVIGFLVGRYAFQPEPEFQRITETQYDTLYLMQEKEIDTIKIKEIKYVYQTKIDSIIIFNLPDSLLTDYSLQLADSIRSRHDNYINE